MPSEQAIVKKLFEQRRNKRTRKNRSSFREDIEGDFDAFEVPLELGVEEEPEAYTDQELKNKVIEDLGEEYENRYEDLKDLVGYDYLIPSNLAGQVNEQEMIDILQAWEDFVFSGETEIFEEIFDFFEDKDFSEEEPFEGEEEMEDFVDDFVENPVEDAFLEARRRSNRNRIRYNSRRPYRRTYESRVSRRPRRYHRPLRYNPRRRTNESRVFYPNRRPRRRHRPTRCINESRVSYHPNPLRYRRKYR